MLHGVNRVVYVSGPPVHTPVTSVTPTYLTPEVISQLQEADDIVNNLLFKHQLTRTISQVLFFVYSHASRAQLKGVCVCVCVCVQSKVPVVSIPVHFDAPKGHRSIVIRTLITNDFMTGTGKPLPPPLFFLE